VNTRNILFIVSGAFEKLPELIAHRLEAPPTGGDGRAAAELIRQATTRDFIAYGFEPEFIGRLPVRVVCEQLRVDDFYEIMERSEGSILRQYERAFRAYGIEVTFVESALREIARQAAEEKTGARGLLTVCERILRNFKYELPGTSVKRFTVDALLIAEPQRVLQQLLVGARVK
jgi:ATP-dependent protease Clp ATPase subunit